MKFKLKRSGPNKRYRFKGYITVKQAERKRRFERQRQAVYQYIFIACALVFVVIAIILLKPWNKIQDILTIFGFI